MGLCISMMESLCYTPKTNTTLEINSTPITMNKTQMSSTQNTFQYKFTDSFHQLWSASSVLGTEVQGGADQIKALLFWNLRLKFRDWERQSLITESQGGEMS